MASEAELRKSVDNDPGHPAFAELAELLRTSGSHSEALDICLAGLSRNPSCHAGRLVLARVFYDRRMYPFAVREIELLHDALPESKTLTRLLEKLSPGSLASQVARSESADDETVAETDFAFDDLDLIEATKK